MTDFTEMGVEGVDIHTGMPFSEFLPQLRGRTGRNTYREMRENDPTIGALMFAVGYLLRSTPWKVSPAGKSPGQIEKAKFVRSVLKDMQTPLPRVITQSLSFLTYGWSWQEITLKRREGTNARDEDNRSKFSDGLIGVRSISIRSQHSLNDWKLDNKGRVVAMIQDLPNGQIVEIPRRKSLYFTTPSEDGNPEGRSLLRNAYVPWYHTKHLTTIESIGIERELAGLPVVRIPARYLRSDATAEEKKIKDQYVKMARDLRYNEQGGAVIPSDPYQDIDGDTVRHSDVRKVDLQLVSASGSRSIDVSSTVKRHQNDMARTVLADFLMLGTGGNTGAFALSKDKSSLFLASLEAFMGLILVEWNESLLPMLWAANGFNIEEMPVVESERMQPVDIETLGKFVNRLAAGGITFESDDSVKRHLMRRADLPVENEDDT